jgi:hypothetical protein
MTVARTSQVVVEVLRINTAPVVRVSQVVVEVLRPNVAMAAAHPPVIFVCM